MIIDSLAHCGSYIPLHPLFQPAFEYLRTFDPGTPDGKYALDGDRLFAGVQRYETAPVETRRWETHRVYADIQVVIAGRELIHYAPVEALQPKTPYNEIKDVEFYDGSCVEDPLPLVLTPGKFAIFLPQDGHQPGCLIGQPGPVMKVVIKLRLN